MRVRRLLPLLAALLLAGWFLPTSLGGATSFVSTHGISMAPRFHTGDVAIVRAVGDYKVGDVVAYHSDQLHTVVLHRIVAVGDGRYTFKGDNNSWLDQEHPRAGQLLGKLVLRVPHGGTWIQRLKTFPTLGALASVLVLTAGAGRARTRTAAGRPSRRRHVMSRHARTNRAARCTSGTLSVTSRNSALLSVGAILLGGALSGVAWAHAAGGHGGAAGSADRPTMRFSYQAVVGRTAAYDQPVVTSPEPLFRKVTQRVDISYVYTGGPGTLNVTIGLSTSSGWRTTLPVGKPTPVVDAQRGKLQLNLLALDARAQAAAAATGMPTGPLTIHVTSSVTDSRGTTFEPTLELSLTPLQLTATSPLIVTGPAARSATAAAGTLRLGTWTLPVETARTLAAGLLSAGLLSGLALLIRLRGIRRLDEGAALRRQYRSLLAPVHPASIDSVQPVFDVTTFQTLTRIAERDGQLILHWADEQAETFLVRGSSHTYRYRTIPTLAVPNDPRELTTPRPHPRPMMG
jgi:signal peptidase I